MVTGSSYSRNDETYQRKSFKKRILCKYPINCAWTLVHMLFWCRGWHGADIRSFALVWYLKGISENSIFSVYNFWKKMPRIAFTRHFTYFNAKLKPILTFSFQRSWCLWDQSMKTAWNPQVLLTLTLTFCPVYSQVKVKLHLFVV